MQIAHDTAAHRFIVEIDGERAVLEYALDGNTMTITHTRVPKPIARRGIAGELMRTALAAAHSQGWNVVPACSYAADYLAKHPTQASDDARQHQSDLLDEALEESFPASDPPAVSGD